MPRPSSKIAPNTRVSVSAHYLRHTTVPEQLAGVVDFNSPGLRFMGTTFDRVDSPNGRPTFAVVLDRLPDTRLNLLTSSLKYEGPRTRPTGQSSRPVIQPQSESLPIEGYISEGAIEEAESDSEEEEIDLNWFETSITTDVRLTHPDTNFSRVNPRIHINGYAHASPAKYFLHFLPTAYIRDIVIPNINEHARGVLHSWNDVSYAEYLTWITLFIIMTIGNFADKKTYWHKGDCPYKPNVNFDEYMRMNRFDDITRMHVFAIHDGERQKEDPLYQIRDFLDQFNDNLAASMDPGRYMCIDESMNQWLGKGVPNLKKVPRKPHPIGQEYKCIADNVTCCILRLDFVSDPKPKKFDDTDRKLIATVKRLAEPWFQSGRTIIADSWFGSPAMTRALLQNGIHSIMQITKRRYWPQGMPATDIISRLDEEYGSVFCMKSLHDSIFVVAYKDLKAKALVSSCCSTIMTGTRQFRDKEGTVHSISRPHVYEVYEKNKSSVDTANNRRDNMTSFHDVMKSYRWEMRCLAFFLGIAEANAFSAMSFFSDGNLLHGTFRWRLAQSMLEYIKSLNEEPVPIERVLRSQDTRQRAHSLVSLGKSRSGMYIRRACFHCRKRIQTQCACQNEPLCRTCFVDHVVAAEAQN